jgi:hypothetical protein
MEELKMGTVNRMVQEAIAECDKVRLPVIVLTDSMKMGTMQLIGNAKAVMKLKGVEEEIAGLSDKVDALTEAVSILAGMVDKLTVTGKPNKSKPEDDKS